MRPVTKFFPLNRELRQVEENPYTEVTFLMERMLGESITWKDNRKSFSKDKKLRWSKIHPTGDNWVSMNVSHKISPIVGGGGRGALGGQFPPNPFSFDGWGEKSPHLQNENPSQSLTEKENLPREGEKKKRIRRDMDDLPEPQQRRGKGKQPPATGKGKKTFPPLGKIGRGENIFWLLTRGNLVLPKRKDRIWKKQLRIPIQNEVQRE